MMPLLWKKLGWVNPAENGTYSTLDFDDFKDDETFPKTEKEAIDNGIDILRKLEFRAMRAADMNYTQSNDYGRKYNRHAIFATIVSGIITIPTEPTASGFIKDYILPYMGNLFNSPLMLTASFIVFPVIIMFSTYYIACPRFLLSRYKEKENVHNNAGAAWQALQIKIQGFLETTTVEKVTPKKITKTIGDFADERKRACEIVCPEQDVYLEVTNAPERCARRVHNLDKSYKTFRKLLKRYRSEHKST